MNTFYQLIDLDSGNVISDFTNEESARNFLQNASSQYGEAVLEDYGLAKMTNLGDITEAFEGLQLKDWVMRKLATASAVTR